MDDRNTWDQNKQPLYLEPEKVEDMPLPFKEKTREFLKRYPGMRVALIGAVALAAIAIPSLKRLL